MNINELKSKIQFSERQVQGVGTEILGEISFGDSMIMSPYEHNPAGVRKIIHREIQHRIISRLYDDRAEAIWRATEDFLRASYNFGGAGCDYKAVEDAKSRMLKSARYQPTEGPIPLEMALQKAHEFLLKPIDYNNQ